MMDYCILVKLLESVNILLRMTTSMVQSLYDISIICHILQSGAVAEV